MAPSQPTGTDLQTPLSRVLGAKGAVKKLEKLGIRTLGELLWTPPRRLHHWGQLTSFSHLYPGTDVTVFALVTRSELAWTRARDKGMLTVQLTDETSGSGRSHLTVRFFARNPKYLSSHAARLQVGTLAVFAGRVSSSGNQAYLAHPEYQVLEDYDPDTAQALADQPWPVYRATQGLPSWKIGQIIRTQLALTDPAQVPDVIGDVLRQRWDLPTAFEALQLLHNPRQDADYTRALRYLRYEEAFLLQLALVQARQKNHALPAPQLKRRQKKLRTWVAQNLPFKLTEGQKNSLQEIETDLAQNKAMGRLLQGDVGSGKTVVAALAGATCLDNDHQVAFLAPTEVLARQHYETLSSFFPAPGLFSPVSTARSGSERLVPSVRIELLTSSTTQAQKRQILADLAAGVPMLVVGTQALLAEQVQPSRLGLLIVDEQHRFGVYQREKLRTLGEHQVHQLVMTATPIPRTVAMSVFGDLEISTIAGLPAGRQEVKTILVPQSNRTWMERIWMRAREEIAAGGRIFVVCPRISPTESEEKIGTVEPHSGGQDIAAPQSVVANVEEVFAFLNAVPALKGVKIGKAHSALAREEKNGQVADFAAGKTQLLVCTTVIEVGMDIPQATMMVILDAQCFGLAQLHQLRGRIGRGNLPGLCLATWEDTLPVTDLEPEQAPGGFTLLTSEKTGRAQNERLEAFAKYSNGFDLAQADLEIRQEGDILGLNQAGRVSSLRYLSLRTDEAIITQARAAAQDLLAADPQLHEHAQLAAALARRIDQESQENLTRS